MSANISHSNNIIFARITLVGQLGNKLTTVDNGHSQSEFHLCMHCNTYCNVELNRVLFMNNFGDLTLYLFDTL